MGKNTELKNVSVKLEQMPIKMTIYKPIPKFNNGCKNC